MASPLVCVCGHVKEAHEHYRRGTDCSICGAEECPRFRKSRKRGDAFVLRPVATAAGHVAMRTPDRNRSLRAVV